MNPETTTYRSWTGDMVDDLWNRDARRGTVLVESAEREALAILIDDGGQPSYYRIDDDQVPAFIASATRAWPRSADGRSVAVIWRRNGSLVAKGAVVPVPHPIDPDSLRPSTVMTHHQLLAVLELALPR